MRYQLRETPLDFLNSGQDLHMKGLCQHECVASPSTPPVKMIHQAD
jgi:hypothetical protein